MIGIATLRMIVTVCDRMMTGMRYTAVWK